MLFGTRQNNKQVKIPINNIEIERVDENKFLSLYTRRPLQP